MLHNKTVLLGVGGGPLTYVAVDVLRTLQRAGARVRVVLSTETEAFVPALTFQTLAGTDVVPATALYGMLIEGTFRSLAALVREAEALLVVPATPSLVAKTASGQADEALVRTVLLHDGPVVFAFPGQAAEYRHLLIQQQLQRLREAGIALYDQGVADTERATDLLEWSLAPQEVVTALEDRVQRTLPLAGKVVLITAGPTQEPIDPVRHISNRSSGKTGFLLAGEAQQRGARVILITGPTHLQAPAGVECIRIQTALEMRQAVLEYFDRADVVIKTAAVADFRPSQAIAQKVKKEDAELAIALERNPDILAELGQRKTHQILIGFAAESQDLLQNARKKVQGKRLDAIVANDISDPGIGFASDDNRVCLLDATGGVEELPVMSKARLAEYILDRVQGLLHHKAQLAGEHAPTPTI
jgi:phosphopantothenoylcysteine decarboxylase/phosphopantothenate--cysteine ligase